MLVPLIMENPHTNFAAWGTDVRFSVVKVQNPEGILAFLEGHPPSKSGQTYNLNKLLLTLNLQNA